MILYGERQPAAPPLTAAQLLIDRPELQGVSVVTDALAARWLS